MLAFSRNIVCSFDVEGITMFSFSVLTLEKLSTMRSNYMLLVAFKGLLETYIEYECTAFMTNGNVNI